MRKVLDAKIVGEVNGKVSAAPYRAVLYSYQSHMGPESPFHGRPGVKIEQQVRGEWVGCPSGWFLDTLLGLDGFTTCPCSDRIALDFGQGWFVTGMRAALAEAINGKGEGR